MSALDLIRILRRGMAELRDADSPSAVDRIAHYLAHELEANAAQDHAGTDSITLPVGDVPTSAHLFTDRRN